MTIREWIAETATKFQAAGIDSPRLDAQLLASHFLNLSRTDLILQADDPLPDSDDLESAVQRRLRREPLPYITGLREFYGRSFRVNPAVLIPRADTETLIDAALTKFGVDDSISALDIGTGSGCIAITLALELPAARVTATDISVEALAVAEQNRAALQADIRLELADLWPLSDQRFNLIVSNPPYIGREEALMPEVAQFEPAIALYADTGGLAVYESIIAAAPEWLEPEGWLMLEIGHTQGAAVSEMMKTSGFTEVVVIRDLGGRDRVVIGRLP